MADFNQKPICPHNEFCGGCIYQEKPYEEHDVSFYGFFDSHELFEIPGAAGWPNYSFLGFL